MEHFCLNFLASEKRKLSSNKIILCIFVITCLSALVYTDEDYYKLLGLSKSATNRQIRQAFKKLALTMHPDKNPNNPEAHDNFLKINRAYEVLKDEDLRKKYDKYGEKGLQDHQGGQYESWNFYRYDFGIYDDDVEIITLDKGDFDAAITSGELWFVNFYFPRCSHCHDLAPTWREFAKEMDGVIRIGAVNCGDNRMLCRSKGITSYPSLYIFKPGEGAVKYVGDRSKEQLIQFAMKYVTTQVTELWSGNFASAFNTAFSSGVGWLVTFCAKTGDCLSSQTQLKLAGMLEGLVEIGWMDCTTQVQLCTDLEMTSSTTAYFPPGSTIKEKGGILFLNSLDAREIYVEVMQYLPDLEKLTEQSFQNKLTHHRWLIFFKFGGTVEPGDYEFKKTKVLLQSDNIQVGTFDCHEGSRICKSLYIHQPSVVIFKGGGTRAFEIHHGKKVLYDIVSFARESINAPVITLSPKNFPKNDREPWLVDFFAPWCPPCRALLPELRKASKQLVGQLKFGTLDCTVHDSLCNTHGIQAYPTTLIFNQSNVHEYEGHHTADELLEFIQRLNGTVNVGSMDCQKFYSMCQKENVQAYPEIRLYPLNAKNMYKYYSYSGWSRNAESLGSWALGFLPQISVELTPEDFTRQVLKGKEHWVVDFYAPWCGPCQNFAPEFELLAKSIKGEIKAGKVDCQSNPLTCQTAGIRAYPTVKFYPFQGEKKKNAAGEYINSREAKMISQLLRKRLEELQPKSKDAFSAKKEGENQKQGRFSRSRF
ncbi:dnaJ homolog subfamily C member 10 isoform X3 [Stegostoma tigrinum]|uniref:dnaJ homolog subfamily C member 10 isoform X3 n=1 Tax=Stegostoma tigrinum TaxID=3053191 RepID=UPI00202AEBC4|nr:dnaJ homolog subfamily C member 10 isoform X3 [Stegostoma tigrinum]